MVLQESYCYKQMQKGSAFQKLRGHKKFSRVYKLNSSHCFITWYPTRTRGSKILISDIKRVKRGVNPNRSNVFPSSAISYSLTIYLNNQAIELLATTSDAADIWLVGLRYLVYRATSHENTVRGMWLTEEFHRLLESTSNEKITTTPTNSTTERNPKIVGQLLHGYPSDEFNQSRLTDYPCATGSDIVGGAGIVGKEPPICSSSTGSSPLTISLQTCIMRIKELSYYCAQFSLASLSARDNRNITEKEFIEMYEFYSSMDPVLSLIFQFNSNGDDYLTNEELAALLRIEFPYLSQVDDVYLHTVVEHYEPIPILRSENCLGIDGLITYLLSPDLSVMNPFHTQVNQDMSHPITHYFINSSHNSFLTGDQLYSQSSDEMISKLLMDGVRHIELDLWDGPDGEPECYHGYTSTSKIKVIVLFYAIRDFAFINSMFPVILDIENHCSVAQQIKVAHYLRDVFKEALFIWKPSEQFDISSTPLLNLRGKIFVKCKRLLSDFTAPSSPSNMGDVSDENSADELPSHCKTFANTPSGNPDVIPTVAEGSDQHEALPFYEQRRKQHILLGKKPTLALSRYLSALVSLRSKTFDVERVNQDASLRECNVLYQINERDAVLHVRQSFFDISSFCEDNLVKLSPSSSRVNSSNPDPVQFWNAGIQCVALNQQKASDKAVKFNKALFKANGSSGYCLKPIYSTFNNQEALELDVMFYFVSRIQAFIQSSVAAMPSHRWTLQVEIKGHMSDTNTRYIDCMNLPNNPEKFTINYPSMAFFCLTLYEELSKSRKFSADFVIPVTSIAAGFKVIPLLGPSSCVAIVDINASSMPPMKEKRKKSFLKLGKRSSHTKKRTDHGRSGPSFELYQSNSFRFARRNNVSTPNLATTGIPSHESSQVQGGASEFGSVYEGHCATVGVPSSSQNRDPTSEYYFPDQKFVVSSLRHQNRSSVHELALSSIANLFKEKEAAVGGSQQFSPSRVRATIPHDASVYAGNAQFNPMPHDMINKAHFAGLSPNELRAYLFDDYSSVPIYDSPMDDQQMSQSCHNSPLHQVNGAAMHSQNVAENLLFANYSEASSYSAHQPQGTNIKDSEGVQSSILEDGVSFPEDQLVMGSDSNRPRNIRCNSSNEPRNEARTVSTSKYMANAKRPAPVGRWTPSKMGQRREPKSVIRGRISSLSDNDQFSSEEDLSEIMPSACKKTVFSVSAEQSQSFNNDGDIEDNLNLSNLAAEIEEEFGAVTIHSTYSEDEDLILYSRCADAELAVIQNSGADVEPLHGADNAGQSSFLNNHELSSPSPTMMDQAVFEEDQAMQSNNDCVPCRRQTSGYESGFESPPPSSSRPRDSRKDSLEKTSVDGSQFFYHTTMV